ncbi:MAG: hypothetical protein HMLKMBBP_00098 [Planctomycetes bacterium]|nr:hypothetical protein [Planctomycetota bacterium]
MNALRAPVCDVRLGETPDRLVVTPRAPDDVHRVVRALRAVPDIGRVRVAAEGLSLASTDAIAILEGVPTTIDLRWSEEARRAVENRRQAVASHSRVLREARAIASGGRVTAEAYLADVDGLEPLDDHQWANVAAMTLPGSPGLCVFDEQGAGKTVTTIFGFDVLASRGETEFLLIIAPKSMIAEWPRDFERFKGDLYRVAVAAGTRTEKRAVLRSGANVIVTNFETAIAAEPELRALLRRYGDRAMLVVDESFFVKNLDAARTRAIRRLREWCGRAYVLCGTPAPNAPQDLVEQFNIVDFGMTFDGLDVPADRSLAAPVVSRAIDERGLFIRHLKADVLPDLPGKRFHRVSIPMSPQQATAYRAALQDMIIDLRGTSDAAFRRRIASFLARRSALLQICSNAAALVPGYTETPPKLEAMDSLLERLIGREGEKVVVWSFYTASIDALIARYAQYRPVRYDGTVADVAERRESIRRFQEDDSTMLFVGNPAAAGAGITLHRARIAVYESLSNQAAHYLQSLDRIHRRGQTRPVEYVVLLTADSIELAEYDRLTRKEMDARDLLGDTTQPNVTREVLLDEALAAAERIGLGPVE